ncbi:uncharacterized protein LOC130700652 [Daphnia carinata]|uniref:uncharacterized protein LOC130700652 n=1 Tax=Daphnia carinata TaxID=120202 RepID=UPI00257FCBFD|nr:uncharacterized protein LOC130700652 [Daphnia carinata]
MKNVVFIFAALLAVLGSAEESMESGETFVQDDPFAQRAFFYYPTGAGGFLNRAATPPQSAIDFVDSPFDIAPQASAQDMVPNPAAYFVPTSDLLAMPYPSKIDQEADEKAAMKHLEMLKGLHDELEKTEEKFLKPSMSFGGNAVTLPTNAFMSLLHKLSKTVTKTVVTTQFTTVFVSVSPSKNTTETTASVTALPSSTDITATSTPTVTVETTSTVLETISKTVESTPSAIETTTAATTSAVVEPSSTASLTVTTTPPLIIVTTITSTIL